MIRLRFPLSLMLVVALARAAQPAPPSPGATPSIRTAKPERAAGAGLLSLPARTAPSEQAYLYSRATGWVGERRVDIGDRVKAGDILAVVEAPEIRRSVERAKAGLAQTEARLELAQTAVKRARSLAEKRVIAPEELEEREANSKVLEADVLAARAELDRLEEVLRFQTIRAPFSGTIAARRVDRGDHVQGDQSQQGRWMFQLVRLDELVVEVNAPPAAALRVQAGQTATVEFAEMPGRTFAATVARSARVLDPASGTMRVELSLPNPDLLIPAGLTGVVRIAAGAEGTLVVPTQAVLVRMGQSQVMKVVEGRATYVAVQTGRNLGAKIEVLSGVGVDDVLVVSPNALIEEGTRLP